jgi:hypothetical protein
MCLGEITLSPYLSPPAQKLNSQIYLVMIGSLVLKKGSNLIVVVPVPDHSANKQLIKQPDT